MTRSGPTSLYDDDFFAWTQDQAAALRETAHAPSGRVDIANIAMEIEDLGKRDLREVTSFLTRLMEHLIKIASHPASPDRSHWLSECGHFQSSAADAYTPSMRQLIDVEKLWLRAVKRARAMLEDLGAVAVAPDSCPFTLDEMLAEDFSIRSALNRFATHDP